MIKKLLFNIILLTLSFLIGANFVHSKHWPYHFFRQLGVGGLISNIYAEGEDGFFEEIFSDELIARDHFLPDIIDRESLILTVDAMAAPRVDIRGVSAALQHIGPMVTRELPQDELALTSVKYLLDKRQIEVYAYKINATGKSRGLDHACATLIIPGSGRDQALAIAQRKTRNYHAGILEPFADCDVFVLIKPNEDYLSITHDGNKLSENAYINHLVGIGSSYSSRYVIDAIALMLELKRRYPRTIVTGLSQGGTAAVIVGIEARPNLTVAASGLYEIQADLGYGGFNSTLLFPRFQRAIFKDWIPVELRKTDVDFLIIGGIHESGLNGQDFRESWTCNKLIGMPRVTCLSHSGGHIYPSAVVKSFLARHYSMSQKSQQ